MSLGLSDEKATSLATGKNAADRSHAYLFLVATMNVCSGMGGAAGQKGLLPDRDNHWDSLLGQNDDEAARG